MATTFRSVNNSKPVDMSSTLPGRHRTLVPRASPAATAPTAEFALVKRSGPAPVFRNGPGNAGQVSALYATARDRSDQECNHCQDQQHKSHPEEEVDCVDESTSDRENNCNDGDDNEQDAHFFDLPLMLDLARSTLASR